MTVADALVHVRLATSKGEARRLVFQNAVSIGDAVTVRDPDGDMRQFGSGVVVRVGRHRSALFIDPDNPPSAALILSPH